MQLTSINNLEKYKIVGCNYNGFETDEAVSESESGVTSRLIKKKKYKYTLSLQALTKDEVKSIVNEILESLEAAEKVSIPIEKLSGYINFEDILGDPQFSVDTKGMRATQKVKLYKMTLPLIETFY